MITPPWTYFVQIAVLAVFAVILMRFFGIWLRARVSGAPVAMLNLIAMWLRKSPMALIVDSRITAKQAGLDITIDQLEAHHIAGGSVADVVLAKIAADHQGNSLTFDQVCAIDLAFQGTDNNVLEAARENRLPDILAELALAQETSAN